MKVKTVALIAVILGAPLLGKYVMNTFFGPNDQEMIQSALQESIAASREGRPGGVVEKLTDNFKINEMSPGNKSQIAKFIRDSRPDIEIPKTAATVSDDTARVTAPVHVSLNFLGRKFEQKIDGVTLVFQKESGREWLVIPVKRWKLDKVFLPETLNLESFVPGMPGM